MKSTIFYFAEMADDITVLCVLALIAAAYVIVQAAKIKIQKNPMWGIKVFGLIFAVAASIALIVPSGNTVLRMALAQSQPDEIVNLIRETITKITLGG